MPKQLRPLSSRVAMLSDRAVLLRYRQQASLHVAEKPRRPVYVVRHALRRHLSMLQQQTLHQSGYEASLPVRPNLSNVQNDQLFGFWFGFLKR